MNSEQLESIIVLKEVREVSWGNFRFGLFEVPANIDTMSQVKAKINMSTDTNNKMFGTCTELVVFANAGYETRQGNIGRAIVYSPDGEGVWLLASNVAMSHLNFALDHLRDGKNWRFELEDAINSSVDIAGKGVVSESWVAEVKKDMIEKIEKINKLNK